MPQNVKVSPPDPAAEVNPSDKLEGWIPPLATPEEIRGALEKAFDYRGDITVTLRDGRQVEGYVFDRQCKGPALDQCSVRMFPKDSNERMSIAYCDVARLEFSGRDTAAGKSFATWLKKYVERKAAGEQNIGLHPEPL